MPETHPGGLVASTIADAIVAEHEVVESARRAIRAAEDEIRGAEQRIRESTADQSPITVAGPAALPAHAVVAGSPEDPQPAVLGGIDSAPLSSDPILVDAPAPAAVLGTVPDVVPLVESAPAELAADVSAPAAEPAAPAAVEVPPA
jgi:hypothetical protein